MKSYVSKIQELEGELLRVKSLNNENSSRYVDWVGEHDDGFTSKNALFGDGKSLVLTVLANIVICFGVKFVVVEISAFHFCCIKLIYPSIN